MSADGQPDGALPPRQARSRAALERLLAAAQEILATRGFDDFTIAAVAERAGVSVGGVYRRFPGKEQLLEAVVERTLGDLQATITAALTTAGPGIDGVIAAFTGGFADYLGRVGPLYSAVLSAPRPAGSPELGLAALTALQRLFLDAALPHSAQITHRAPSTALTTALRTILAAGVHRAAVAPWWPDGLSWTEWADEIAAMTTGYLVGG